MGLQLGQRLVRAHGGLAAGLEAGVVVGQRLGQHAAGHGGVLDRRDLGVGGPAALELGDHQAPVGAEPEHRDAVAGGAAGGRNAVELEGDDLDGRAQDGGVRQHPLLQIGALLQARLFERDHLRRHRDGPGDGEEHLFRHFSDQARANGCFCAGTESHTKSTTEPQNSRPDACRRVHPTWPVSPHVASDATGRPAGATTRAR